MKFKIELDQVFGLFPDHEAASQLHMLLAESLVDVLSGYPEGGHPGGQQFNPDRTVPPPAEPHFTDTINRFQALFQNIDRVLIQLLLRAVTRVQFDR